jgi:hypothetical protein
MRKMIVLVLCAGVSGCVSSPKGNVTPISAVDIFQKLGCELRAEAERNPAMINDGWAINAELELTSSVGSGLGGSATGNDSISNGTFAFALPLDYSRSVDRVYNQKVGIVVQRILPSDCDGEFAKTLGGTLGVAELFAEYRATQQRLPSNSGPWLESSSKKSDGFSGSTTFVVTRSFSALGPTWTLTHLTAGFGLGASVADTNKLSITVGIPKRSTVATSARGGAATPASSTAPQVQQQRIVPIDPGLQQENLRNLEIFTLKDSEKNTR